MINVNTSFCSIKTENTPKLSFHFLYLSLNSTRIVRVGKVGTADPENHSRQKCEIQILNKIESPKLNVLTYYSCNYIPSLPVYKN